MGCNHIPLPWQWEFHSAAREADKDDGPVDIGLGGARGPGKSHSVLAQAALDDCQRIPSLKGLFLRQTGIAASESFDDLIDKVVRGRAIYKKTSNNLQFPNGSRIMLGGFKNDKDIDKYIGIEYDFIIVEELNQITWNKYRKLRGSLRTSKPNWRPRMYTSFNPGGIGHSWVKQRYIIPNREKKEDQTRFIGSTYKENPYLNKEYIDYLEELEGDLGRAWREGDWDLFEGQVFDEFRYNKHVIRVITPKMSLLHALSTDWGYSDQRKSSFSTHASVLVVMRLQDGTVFNRVITYQEWAGNKKAAKVWAEKIYNEARCRKFRKWVVDRAMLDAGNDPSRTIANDFDDKWTELNKKNKWIPSIEPGSKNRIKRIAMTHQWLSDAPDGKPYWLITEDCTELIRTLPLLQYNEEGKGKKEDLDTEGEDDQWDDISYMLSTIKFIGGVGLFGGKRVGSTPVIPVSLDKQKRDILGDFSRAKIKKKRSWSSI